MLYGYCYNLKVNFENSTMSATPSTMLPLGTEAPDFKLPNTVTGDQVSLSDFDYSEALLVVFTSNHCPYAINTMPGVIDFANDYSDKNISVVAISSNNIESYPEDAPEMMKELAIEDEYPFPYLFDETQQVAKDYTAACTPDVFLFDNSRKLVYRGQFDDSRPGNNMPNDGKFVRDATDQLLAGKKVTVEQKPSLGCNIKWKEGNEPDYFSY